MAVVVVVVLGDCTCGYCGYWVLGTGWVLCWGGVLVSEGDFNPYELCLASGKPREM